jgi:hypothetical protein
MTAKIARSAGFFVLWVIIAGTEPVDLLFGIPASLLVASASLQLLPPGTKRPSIVAFAGLVPRFPSARASMLHGVRSILVCPYSPAL